MTFAPLTSDDTSAIVGVAGGVVGVVVLVVVVVRSRRGRRRRDGRWRRGLEVLVGPDDQREQHLVAPAGRELADPERQAARFGGATQEVPVVALHDGGEVLAAEDQYRGDAPARATAAQEIDEVGAPRRVGGTSERVLVQRVDEAHRIARALARAGEVLVGRQEGQLELLEGEAGADLPAPVGETARVGRTPEQLLVHVGDHVGAVLVARDERRRDGTARNAAVERARPVAQAVGVGGPPEQVRVDLLDVRRRLGGRRPERGRRRDDDTADAGDEHRDARDHAAAVPANLHLPDSPTPARLKTTAYGLRAPVALIPGRDGSGG